MAGSTTCTRWICVPPAARGGVRSAVAASAVFSISLAASCTCCSASPSDCRCAGDALADAPRGFRYVGDDRDGFVAERVDADADAADEQRHRHRRADRARHVAAAPARRPSGLKRVAQEHAEDDRDEHRLRILQHRMAASTAMIESDRLRTLDRHADDVGAGRAGVVPVPSLGRRFLFAVAGVPRLCHMPGGRSTNTCPRRDPSCWLADFDFALPDELIAQTAAAARRIAPVRARSGDRSASRTARSPTFRAFSGPAISSSSTTRGCSRRGCWVTGCPAAGRSSACC